MTNSASSPLPAPGSQPRSPSNKSLFSQHYLQTRLSDHAEWSADPLPAFEAVRGLWERAHALGRSWNEAQTEQEFVKPVLDVLGWSYIVQVKGGSASAPKPVLNTGQAWAVLVGVNAYEDAYHFGPLQVCVHDVEATREQLIAGGFDPARIRLLTDNTDDKPTRANVLAALKSVADATEPGDLLLFYYSGHGDEAGGDSYLVARDGRRLVLGDTAVSVTRVKQIMDSAPARAKVILLDACHSGANIGQKGPKPMTKEFIARVFEQAERIAILASCKQGQLSYEWRAEERSVFTHYLLDALKGEADRDGKGFVTVQDASRHVTDGVKLWASQRNVSQTPTLQYTVAGDIALLKV